MKSEGPVGRSVMPHISVMLGSILLGGSIQRNREKNFGTSLVLPLLLGFRYCWVRSSGASLYIEIQRSSVIATTLIVEIAL